MPRKTKSEQEDLAHILQTTIVEEGYDIDAEVDREILRLAKFIVLRSEMEDPDEEETEEFGGFEDEEDLFDEYGDEEGLSEPLEDE